MSTELIIASLACGLAIFISGFGLGFLASLWITARHLALEVVRECKAGMAEEIEKADSEVAP